VGGDNIGETVEGLQRFPINMRYPRETATRWKSCASLPIVTERGARLVLSDVADIRITDGPPMLRSENARLSGWVYVDIRGRDLRRRCRTCRRPSPRRWQLPPGYSISWSGQFEFLERATAKLKVVVPFTLLIIFVLLYLTFKRFEEAAADHGHAAVRAGGRHLAALPAGLQPVGGRCGGLHRAGRRLGRVRRDHAAVPQARLGRAHRPRQDRRGPCWTRSAKALCCGCGPRP
jgi:Cu/Ag efflux pump CusA